MPNGLLFVLMKSERLNAERINQYKASSECIIKVLQCCVWLVFIPTMNFSCARSSESIYTAIKLDDGMTPGNQSWSKVADLTSE